MTQELSRSIDDKNTIIEALKKKDINNINNNQFNLNQMVVIN